VSEIPWWALPLVAAVFALAGAGVTLLVSARDEYARSRAKRTKRWYAERKEAYVTLLAEFERATYRLRAAYDGGQPPPGPFTYVDAVGPAKFVTDLGLLENRFAFARALRREPTA